MAATVITRRLDLANAASRWREFFAGATVTTSPDAPAVLVRLDLAPDTPPVILIDLFFRRALDILSWSASRGRPDPRHADGSSGMQRQSLPPNSPQRRPRWTRRRDHR